MKRFLMVSLAALLCAAGTRKSADPDAAMQAAQKPADNSGKNVRDRDDATLTPADQAKGSDADVRQRKRSARRSSTTARFRRTRTTSRSSPSRHRHASRPRRLTGGEDEDRVDRGTARWWGTKVKDQIEVAP